MGNISERLRKPKIANTRVKRVGLTLFCVVMAAFVLVIVFISPLTKYLIEKYDERYTGRQITMDWAYVNPFTGFVHFSNVQIYEAKKDTLFVTAKGVSADFSLMKLFSKTFEITELTIDQPRGTVIQKNKALNFDDLIVRFTPDALMLEKTPVRINVLHVKIAHGEFYYHEKVIPIHYVIKDLNLESSGKRWNADTIEAKFSFLSPNGKGAMKGNFTVNVKTQDYRLATTVRNFDLEIIRQYLWELINYGMFSAQLDAKIKATGNFKRPDSIHVKGRFEFKDFHFGKTKIDDYAAFDKLLVVIDDLSPMNKKFLFDSITLRHPFFKYEKFDSLDNMEMLFGKNGSNVSDITSQSGRFNLIVAIGRYLRQLARNFFQSHYRINRLVVTRGDLTYSDFSLSEQFTISSNAFDLRADSIDRHNKRERFFINSGVKPYGELSLALSINPKDSGDFDMTYHLNKVPISVFNPYLISYTSFPLDRGTLELQGVWNVRHGEIKSVNHLLVLDPRVSRRLKNKDLKWIPLPWIMAFVRERGNVVDYEIPISGNLKNPHFHLKSVLMDVLKNIFVKPVTIPYGITVKSTEREIENTISLRWDMGQRTLRPKQKRFVEKIVSFLENDAKASIEVYPQQYALKEKEYILFFEAKKKYFLLTRSKTAKSFTREDSMKVDKMSIKEPSLMHALKVGKGAGDTLMFTIQDKCRNFVGRSKVEAQYKELVKQREREFRSFFIKKGIEKSVNMHRSEDNTPYNGFSYYEIIYKGDVPKALQSAYEEMHELNDESFRKQYYEGKEKDLSAKSQDH